MSASLGVNLRITSHGNEGGRKYMEDYFSIAYQRTDDDKDLEFAYFGIFDGHGGSEAALFAKDHLMEFIVQQRLFWSDRDEDVLKAIREGFIATHMAMLKEQEKWPRTASGLPSTAGTTASIAFIRRARIYTGHVGDSGIILGYQNPGSPNWEARRLTRDHKPESRTELQRIEQSGGKVVAKSGVPRVVWYRPQIGHKGPITRSTPMDEIPFLAVARSLGDLWSYNSANNEFVVSPEPDTNVIYIDTNSFRCLIFGTDGLWNMISPSTAVSIIQAVEQHNLSAMNENPREKTWTNPSVTLVEKALERWSNTRMRADNTTAVTLLLDPPGPPRDPRNNQKVYQQQKMNYLLPEDPLQQSIGLTETQSENITASQEFYGRGLNENPYPATGLEIVTRYADQHPQGSSMGAQNLVKPQYTEEYLDKLHQEYYSSVGYGEENFCEDFCESTNTSTNLLENIQINVVSSSSDHTKKSKMKKVSTNFASSVSTSTKGVKLKNNQNERRCKSLEPEKVLKSDSVCENTRFLRSQTTESSKKCDSVGPSQKDTNFEQVCLKTIDNIDRQRRSRSLGPKEPKTTRSSNKQLINQSVLSPQNFNNSSRLKRSQSLGPSDLSNVNNKNHNKLVKTIKNKLSSDKINDTIVIKKELSTKSGFFVSKSPRTRSQGLIGISSDVNDNCDKKKQKSNFLKQGDSNFALQERRSRSLGPKDLLNIPSNSSSTEGVKTRSCQTPHRLKSHQTPRPKRDRIIDSDEENVVLNGPKMKRCRSLGPFEFPIKDLAIKRSRGRPPKRERNESDEENNILSAPKFKRSRSLGPRDLRPRDTFLEHNKLPDNFLDRSKDETTPNTRSQRNRRLPT